MPPATISASTRAPAPRSSCGRTNSATQPSAMNSDVMSQRGAGRHVVRQMSRIRIPAARRAPDDREYAQPGPAAQRQAHQRGVGAGDQQQDAHVVQPGQQPSAPAAQRRPVVCRGHTEQGHARNAIYGGGEPGRPRRGKRDQHDASSRGDRESPGMQHSPEPGCGSTGRAARAAPASQDKHARRPASVTQLSRSNRRYEQPPPSQCRAGSPADGSYCLKDHLPGPPVTARRSTYRLLLPSRHPPRRPS
jgi:hypothetical protein